MGQSDLITRRRLVVGTASLLGAAALDVGAQGAISPAKPSWISTADREVDFVPASDSRFQGLIGNLYPGLLNDSAFQSVAPLSAMLIHERGPSIKACSVCWAVT